MRRAILLVGVALGGLAGSTVHAWEGPSQAIFPPQKLPLRFSHKQHLRLNLACDFCHDDVEASISAADNLIPGEDVCATCHKIDRNQPLQEAPPPPDGGRPPPSGRCETCHLSVVPEKPERVEMPEPNLKFNHKVHLRKKIACDRCHGDLAQVDLATRAQLPRMPLCLGCHNQTATAGRAPAKCSTCHLTQVDGTLRTHFPSGILAPSGALKGDAHTPDFARRHAQVAAADERYCENCHRRDFCLGCHNGVVKPMSIHGNDYLSIHAIEAVKATQRCDGCHRRQTFCLGCHERAGLTDPLVQGAPNGLDRARPRRRFHPPYERWVKAPRTPEHHSWPAERNLRQCVACHREETCLECHSASGPSRVGIPVSPHPPGFPGSRACTVLAQKNGRVCLKCHAPTDAHLSCQ